MHLHVFNNYARDGSRLEAAGEDLVEVRVGEAGEVKAQPIDISGTSARHAARTSQGNLPISEAPILPRRYNGKNQAVTCASSGPFCPKRLSFLVTAGVRDGSLMAKRFFV